MHFVATIAKDKYVTIFMLCVYYLRVSLAATSLRSSDTDEKHEFGTYSQYSDPVFRPEEASDVISDVAVDCCYG